jgi:hypothetical protein
VDRVKETFLWVIAVGVLGALVRIARDERDLSLWPALRMIILGIGAAFLVDGLVVAQLNFSGRVAIPCYMVAGFLASEIFESLILRVRRDGLGGLIRELKRKE